MASGYMFSHYWSGQAAPGGGGGSMGDAWDEGSWDEGSWGEGAWIGSDSSGDSVWRYGAWQSVVIGAMAFMSIIVRGYVGV